MIKKMNKSIFCMILGSLMFVFLLGIGNGGDAFVDPQNKTMMMKNPSEREVFLRGYWYYNQGNKAIREARFEDAVSLYKNAMGCIPREYDIQYNLAYAYLCAQQYSSAIELFSQLKKKEPRNIDIVYNIALSYQLKGDQDSALKMYDEILTIKPQYPRALNNKGMIFFKKGFSKEAQQLLEKAFEIDPSSAVVRYNLGNIYLSRGQYIQAWNMCEPIQVPSVVPRNALLGVLAKSAFKTGQYQKAVALYSERIGLCPSCDENYYYLGMAYNKLSAHADAILAFQKVSKASGYYRDAQLFIGKTYARQKKYNESLEYLFHAYVHTKDAMITDYIGQILFAKGEYQKAKEKYEEAVAIDPNFSKGWYHLGLVHFVLNQNTAAKKAFTRAIDLKPSFDKPYGELARLYRAKEDYKKAVDILIAGLEHGRREELMFELADIYAETGNYDPALLWYKRILQKNRSSRAMNAMAGIYIQQKRYPKAERLLENIKKKDPSYPGVYVNLGILYVRLNKIVDAVQSLQHAISLDPQDATVYFNLALIYYQEGQLLYSRDMLTQCLKRDPSLKKAESLIARIDEKIVKENKVDARLVRHKKGE